jgi:hypothetical protein
MILLASKVKISGIERYTDRNALPTKPEMYLASASWLVYIMARFGTFALMLASLRALPKGAYISIDWLATIPHI